MDIQAEIEKMNEALQPLLPEGAVVVAEIAKSRYGTSGGGLEPMPGGEYNLRELQLRMWEDDISKITDPMSDMIRFVLQEKGLKRAVGIFRFEKGAAPTFSVPTDAELVAVAREKLGADLTRFQANHTGVQLDIQFLVEQDGVDVEMVVLKAMDGKWEEDSMGVANEVFLCLRETNGNDISRMVVFLEGDNFWIASDPPKPALGFKDLSEVTLKQDEALQKRFEAINTARSMREEFYKSLGEYHAVNYEPYIPSRLRGGHEWPCKDARFQLIYTSGSTIVISSGLSDVFRDQKLDPKLEYNGYAVEFYIEFQGRIAWSELEKHPCLEWLNTITQVAIGHGKVKGLLERHGTISVQLSASGLPATHLRPGEDVTALLGIPSPNMPAVMPMNIEQTLLASITILPLKEGRVLESGDENKRAAARKEILAARAKAGLHCYNPFVSTR